jgi:hypothetical protein
MSVTRPNHGAKRRQPKQCQSFHFILLIFSSFLSQKAAPGNRRSGAAAAQEIQFDYWPVPAYTDIVSL